MADYLNYVLSNPDLRENAEALGLTNAEMAEWGQTHYENHGQNEGRENTPTAITNTEGYTQTLGERHYQGRDPYEVLQASVRSAAGGDFDESMWTAREAIDPKWNLGQYTAEGWNLDPDNPYKTGILGDTLAVNTGIGQLVPTTAGDQRFLQDRYVDASIANDFPVGWTTPENTWAAAAPQQLGNYWDVLTNATRTPEGILRRAEDYDPLTAVGPSVSPGTRGGGNIRPDRGGAGYGGPLIGGPPNPTVPSFGFPGYQDWTRFMPTNFQLAEGGGMHYQPWATGTPQGGGPYTVYSSCFVDGVQVELVDGSEKNVSEISVGDEVKTDKGDGVVTKIYPSKAGGQKLYGFNDKEPFVTEAHPFMTQDGWKKISEVTEGDTLYRNGKGIVTVESITSKDIPEDTPVYNFHVDGHETYFADGYLVHNKTYAPGYEPGGPNFVPGTGSGIIGTDPNIWGNTNTTTTNTGVIPGSDKANDLANGRTHHDEMYDHNDMWVGAEGGGAREAGVDINRTTGQSYGQPSYGSTSASAGYPNVIATGKNYGPQFMNLLASNPVTRIQNLLNSQLGFVNGIDTSYGAEGADGQGESEADIEADIEATRDGGLVA